MAIALHLPLLESILDDWQETIGDDFQPYKNHVYRVVNFCLALHPCKHDDQEKFIIAGCFHDLGMWTNDTVDYLEPSIELAKKYLQDNNLQRWSTEIELMIDEHHKITRYEDRQYPLVEVFRKADWVDVSMGLRAAGLAKKDVQLVKEKFPNLGFHKNLVKLATAEFVKHPLKCMPMMKW